jgi:hypothetical protein
VSRGTDQFSLFWEGNFIQNLNLRFGRSEAIDSRFVLDLVDPDQI